MAELKLCEACGNVFYGDDEIVYVDSIDKHYHSHCVEVYPSAFGVTTTYGEYIGTSEDGVIDVYTLLDTGEYIDYEEL